MPHPLQALRGVWRFYADGFRAMTTGRRLWAIILVKLFIIFAVLRVFFFQPAMGGMSDAQKQRAVAGSIVVRR